MTPSALDLWPAAASARAVEVDHLIIAFTVVLLLLTVPIFAFMAYCAFRYRAGRTVDRTHRAVRSLPIELSWMLVPFGVSLVFFVWAARIYDQERNPPPDSLVITGMGRQWMWKFQHPGGQSEINDLHVPQGQPVRIDLFSQDVIHALYVPALRVQFDAIPGRTTQVSFTADTPGAYLLLCSEFCGTDHAVMGGTLYVMPAPEYQAWLASHSTPPPLADSTLGNKR